MVSSMRWDPCISHRGEKTSEFISDYFKHTYRRVLLIAGAGFDPRSHKIPQLIAASGGQVEALFLQENRPGPADNLVDRGRANAEVLASLFTVSDLKKIDIFGTDNAVVGGRNAVRLVNTRSLENVTDVVVDISALSVGVSFPIIRYYAERLARQEETANLHVFVAHDPALDEDIRPISGDAPTFIHGFKGGLGLDSTVSSARLWLPQLANGRVSTMRRLYDFVEPHDVCPILPFPSANPRAGDYLAEHYLEELDRSWAVDARNVIYAAESDPLDLYRTILRMDDLRTPVFEGAGGSQLILSPAGSKVLALGALLAALDRNLPIAYLESVGYEFQEAELPFTHCDTHLVHVWLEGEVYP